MTTTASRDHRSFSEIARAWAIATRAPAEEMMAALVCSFWRGDFEHGTKSEVFMLLQPSSGSIVRQPGNFATSGRGIIVKVGADLRSYPTAEREEISILRRHIASGLGDTPWIPWPWDGTDEGLDGFATIPYDAWPTNMKRSYYCEWHIRRGPFAKWYTIWPLSGGVPLEQFWPRLASDRSVLDTSNSAGPRKTRQKFDDRPKKRRGRKPGDGTILADQKLLNEMKQLIDAGHAPSPNAAAGLVQSKATGGGTEKSKQSRLLRKFKKWETKDFRDE